MTGVHLKSSSGRAGHEDCENARRRMGMAAALTRRYEGGSAVLIIVDFNIDPGDRVRAIYDRTGEILGGRAFARLCPGEPQRCGAPTYRSDDGPGAAVDLAFFRGGGAWRAILSAPHRENCDEEEQFAPTARHSWNL